MDSISDRIMPGLLYIVEIIVGLRYCLSSLNYSIVILGLSLDLWHLYWFINHVTYIISDGNNVCVSSYLFQFSTDFLYFREDVQSASILTRIQIYCLVMIYSIKGSSFTLRNIENSLHRSLS